MIAQLIERGYELEYWDVSQYVAGGVVMDSELKRDFVEKMTSNAQVESALKRTAIERTIFVVELRECWENRKLFEMLAAYNCYMISLNTYANVLPMGVADRLKTFVCHPIRTIGIRVGIWIYGWYKRRRGYTTFRDAFSSSAIGAGVTRRINHPDYERFRDMTKGERAESEPYILFVDNYFPEHPDIQYRLKCRNLDGDRYRRSLVRYFEILEAEHRMAVKIAAHPKARYTSESFGGREIVQYRSEEMVSYASAVIMHTSNAVSFALLANKPLQIITNEEYDKCQYLRLMMSRIADKLGCEICDIDRVEMGDRTRIEPVDKAIRESYIYDYLTDSSIEKMSNIDILTEYINNAR